jgi:3'-phosphoadenosine 5'-phosphosulfate sulfotransferase (PAPS reductase)/FAD synthetase
MLDLCIWKGRFPSRKAQFCTEELKTVPLQNFQQDLIEAGNDVWSWQGIRADESLERRYRPEFEEMDDHLFVYRPLLRWSAESVFEALAYSAIKPNPLYLQGMRRVGCMPCINCSKEELAQLSRRWPEVIERIALWEACVTAAAKRGAASFFPAPHDGRDELQGRNIRERVTWSKTSFGGRPFDIFAELPPARCHSFYQLCE